MTKTAYYIGIDLGAGSGRAILATLRDGALALEEIHRFANGPIQLGDRLVWNFPGIWQNIVEALCICARKGVTELDGIGVDSWGIDFGLIGPDGELLGNPTCYRDAMMEGVEELMTSRVGADNYYRIVGQPPARVSSLAQLTAMANGKSRYRLEVADSFLMIPDLCRYFLCGDKGVEKTAAGGSQLVDIDRADWSKELFERMSVPMGLMPRIVESGAVVGHLREDLCRATGLRSAPVIAVPGHDTASAAAAVPFRDESTIFISSGTWCVFGVANDVALTDEQAIGSGFINEYGFESVLFVRNLLGLYLFENLSRQERKIDPTVDYGTMDREAEAAEPFSLFLDTSNEMFFAAEDPLPVIQDFLVKTGQGECHDRGTIVRALFEALAFAFRDAYDDLQRLTGRRMERICLLGGGTKNRLLCQMTADATGLPVIAGPTEATTVGNLTVQALATGAIDNRNEIGSLIEKSFPLNRYQPEQTALWNEKLAGFHTIATKSKNLN